MRLLPTRRRSQKRGSDRINRRLVSFLFVVGVGSVVLFVISGEDHPPLRAATPLVEWRGFDASTTTTTRKTTTATTTTTLLTTVQVPLNPNSTLAQDLVSIEHVPSLHQIRVALKPEARCRRPFLVGRLSGPALIRLSEFKFVANIQQQQQHADAEEEVDDLAKTTSNHNGNLTTLLATYSSSPIIPAGNFFLEIIVIYCNDISYGLQNRLLEMSESSQNNHHNNDNNSSTILLPSNEELQDPNGPWTFDLQVCLEDHDRHRLTHPNATITVDNINNVDADVVDAAVSHRHTHHATPGGIWKKKEQQQQQQAIISDIEEPVFTRFQSYQCYRELHVDKVQEPSPVCSISLQDQMKPYEHYQFQWMDESLINLSISDLQQPQPTKICHVGWSHSRKFMEGWNEIGLSHPSNSYLNVSFTWIKARYPGDIGLQQEAIATASCDKLVIGLYQWPCSENRGGIPDQWGDYYKTLKGEIQALKQRFGDDKLKIFIRSVHVDTLRGTIVHCPPKNWCNPAVLQGYQKINQQICQETGATFLDSSFLTEPLWDARPDYNHLGTRENRLEVLSLTARALGVVKNQDHQQKVIDQ